MSIRASIRSKWLALCSTIALAILMVGAIGTPQAAHAASPALYTFTSFTNSSQSNLYVYQSSDGLNFHALAAPATFTSPTGYLRDPSITRIGSRYYVAYTDNTFANDNHTFGIAYSTNLINWTFLTSVTMPSGTFKTWAPEWFKDTDGSINIIVNLNRTNSGDSNFIPHLVTALNSSLTSWSAATPLAGIGPNYIDAFPVKIGNTYHIFTKNETTKYIEQATASKLGGPYTFVGTGNWAGWGQYLEGPALYQLDDGTWRIIMDGYNAGSFWYSDSHDLFHSWTAKQKLPDGLSGVVRHGTVLKENGNGAGGPAGYTFCAPENGHCGFSGSMKVAYGASGSFYYKTISGGTACTNAVFGDPKVGTVKGCYVQ
jgi:Glycosyl hydrolases family 43